VIEEAGRALYVFGCSCGYRLLHRASPSHLACIVRAHMNCMGPEQAAEWWERVRTTPGAAERVAQRVVDVLGGKAPKEYKS
jgi:hypothetical protein